VSKIEEVLRRKNSNSGLENRKYCGRDPSPWPRGTFYPQKLTLTTPTSGGRSVGTVRLRTEATEFFLKFFKEQDFQPSVQSPTWRTRSLYLSYATDKVVQLYPPGAGFPFRLLLVLAGLRLLYCNQPTRGDIKLYILASTTDLFNGNSTNLCSLAALSLNEPARRDILCVHFSCLSVHFVVFTWLFSIYPILPAALRLWVRLESLTEISSRNLPGGKLLPACKDDNLAAICEPIV
jgi:hypothetical protein